MAPVSGKEMRKPDSRIEDGWYLLRRELHSSGRVYHAGSLVEHRNGEWFAQGGPRDIHLLTLTPEMVCRTCYDGVALYEITHPKHGHLFARPVLSERTPERIDPMVVHLSLQPGEGRVCVKFGQCYLPLELFDW